MKEYLGVSQLEAASIASCAERKDWSSVEGVESRTTQIRPLAGNFRIFTNTNASRTFNGSWTPLLATAFYFGGACHTGYTGLIKPIKSESGGAAFINRYCAKLRQSSLSSAHFTTKVGLLNLSHVIQIYIYIYIYHAASCNQFIHTAFKKGNCRVVAQYLTCVETPWKPSRSRTQLKIWNHAPI